MQNVCRKSQETYKRRRADQQSLPSPQKTKVILQQRTLQERSLCPIRYPIEPAQGIQQ